MVTGCPMLAAVDGEGWERDAWTLAFIKNLNILLYL